MFRGRTGILDLSIAEVSRKLVFQGGEIVYLSSGERAEKLPLRIVARGLAPKEAVVAAAKAGGNLRDALAERGLPAEKYDAEIERRTKIKEEEGRAERERIADKQNAANAFPLGEVNLAFAQAVGVDVDCVV